MKIITVILFFFISSFFSFAQKADTLKQRDKRTGNVVRTRIENGDTIPIGNLKEHTVWAEYVFENEEERKRYRRLVRDIRKTYPQAILISATFKEYENATENMSKRERKKFVQAQEDTLRAQFEKTLKSNTEKQAQILIKLIDRQSGKSTHQIIKQFQGGWSAFKWQSVAKIIGTDLKERYEPKGKDAEIEKIVQMIEEGAL